MCKNFQFISEKFYRIFWEQKTSVHIHASNWPKQVNKWVQRSMRLVMHRLHMRLLLLYSRLITLFISIPIADRTNIWLNAKCTQLKGTFFSWFIGSLKLNFKYILSGLWNLKFWCENFNLHWIFWFSDILLTIIVSEHESRNIYHSLWKLYEAHEWKTIQINVCTQTIQPAFHALTSIHSSNEGCVLSEWTTNLLFVLSPVFFYWKKAHYFSLLNCSTLTTDWLTASIPAFIHRYQHGLFSRSLNLYSVVLSHSGVQYRTTMHSSHQYTLIRFDYYARWCLGDAIIFPILPCCCCVSLSPSLSLLDSIIVHLVKM